ncbi:sodium- and chloride-dependent GABA transporter 1 isoform X2 [Exaiptasia diaphana]|uniref:Transporter n=1 Tax=Exaiptasia diaphana TaxID=2652724 RepID=A0A913Y409_EXADI|nr:sodium- and chloride-dependent GABA transporter 1 isoform X2 [Exaiptasia diaphana]
MSSEDVEIKDAINGRPLLPKGKDSNEVLSQGSDSSGRDSPVVNVDDQRETWGRKADFMLSCVGYAVGLGNIWRFPYLCYANGGGAFLIPYLIMLVICGMPMFYMELAAGQYFSLGPIGVWGSICPLFKGIGMASIVVSFLVCIYYNVIIAWCLYFLAISFRSEVLWKHCNNWWNTDNCYEGRLPDAKNCASMINATINATVAGGNITNCTSINTKDLTSPSLEFWNHYVLEISDGIGNPGIVKWELFLCLVIAWIGIYFCMWKGVKSSGKVVYFTATFPYVVLFILFIRGVTFPGANIGIEYYLTPKWEKLKDPKVWVAAATQIFYSLGIGFGSLVAMGSYNKFHNNIFRDAVTISIINCATSVFAGFVVFSTLGFMSYTLNKPIEEVAGSGPGLVFVVYPQAIAQMPVSPVWAILFFIMILTLGLDSQFGMMEAVITGLVDEYKILNKRKELFVAATCLLCFLPGITHVTQGTLPRCCLHGEPTKEEPMS